MVRCRQGRLHHRHLRREIGPVQPQRRGGGRLHLHGRHDRQGDQGHHPGDGRHLHHGLRDLQAHHGRHERHGMGNRLFRSHGANRGLVQDQRHPDGRRHQEHRRGGGGEQHSPERAARRAWPASDHHARLRGGHAVQGVHHEGGRGRGRAWPVVHRHQRPPQGRGSHPAGDQTPVPRPLQRRRPGETEEGLRFRRGGQVPAADVGGHGEPRRQYPVGGPGHEDRHGGHRTDGRRHEPGHRSPVPAPAPADGQPQRNPGSHLVAGGHAGDQRRLPRHSVPATHGQIDAGRDPGGPWTIHGHRHHSGRGRSRHRSRGHGGTHASSHQGRVRGHQRRARRGGFGGRDLFFARHRDHRGRDLVGISAQTRLGNQLRRHSGDHHRGLEQGLAGVPGDQRAGGLAQRRRRADVGRTGPEAPIRRTAGLRGHRLQSLLPGS